MNEVNNKKSINRAATSYGIPVATWRTYKKTIKVIAIASSATGSSKHSNTNSSLHYCIEKLYRIYRPEVKEEIKEELKPPKVKQMEETTPSPFTSTEENHFVEVESKIGN
ncbi:hypothetical protein WA026_021664 [Henosepilachna vigintioctopunctata]|uniref:HTH psq-type domain-containing protein n=1 Tax=Henosepilachna vigintioctopunctata TaxID=420089 RepID=A0AAW1UBQ7_9CUCU